MTDKQPKALWLADMLEKGFRVDGPDSEAAAELRRLYALCARAMVQQAPDMAEVERLLGRYAFRVECYWQDAERARNELIDYVRGTLAERDALIADNERLSGLYEQAVKGRADMRSALRGARAADPQPVGEVDAVDGIPVPTGHAEADRLIGRLMSSDPDYDDCAAAAALIQREIKGPDGFATWRDAALAERIKRKQQPIAAAEVPMPEHVEQLAITRYRPVPNGMFGYKVVAGDGTRSVFEGTKSECTLIARKLTEAFLDGAHVAGDAREAAGYARGLEVRLSPEKMRIAAAGWREFDFVEGLAGEAAMIDRICSAIYAALRGEVKP